MTEQAAADAAACSIMFLNLYGQMPFGFADGFNIVNQQFPGSYSHSNQQCTGEYGADKFSGRRECDGGPKLKHDVRHIVAEQGRGQLNKAENRSSGAADNKCRSNNDQNRENDDSGKADDAVESAGSKELTPAEAFFRSEQISQISFRKIPGASQPVQNLLIGETIVFHL